MRTGVGKKSACSVHTWPSKKGTRFSRLFFCFLRFSPLILLHIFHEKEQREQLTEERERNKSSHMFLRFYFRFHHDSPFRSQLSTRSSSIIENTPILFSFRDVVIQKYSYDIKRKKRTSMKTMISTLSQDSSSGNAYYLFERVHYACKKFQLDRYHY